MKKYIIKGLFFLIPLYVYAALIVVIDPYEFLNVIHVISPERKLEVLKRSDESSPRGGMLWKMVHYNRNPKKNIIIGDSQSLHIKESLVKDLSGIDFYNFSVPGSSYSTIFETFWYATKKTNLESVYFQIGFMNYNENRDYSLFHYGSDYLDKPYLYFTTKEIFYDTYFNIVYTATGDTNIVNKSYEYNDIEKQNEVSIRSLGHFFHDYSYPFNYQDEIGRITDYCKLNDIEIKFIIFPVYNKVHEYIANNKLTGMNKKFKDYLKSQSYTYDLETNSKLSRNRSNFSDYFHPKEYIVDDLTRQIWSKKKQD